MQITVYKNQYGFRTLAKNGEDKLYISVQFKKGFEPEGDRATVKINNGFFSMYKNKAGLAFPKLVIMEYTLVEENNAQQNDYVPFDDSLPF